MALIKCSHCGKEVSDRAKLCPGCGNPIVAEATESVPAAVPTITCEECSCVYPADADCCPNCGCPAPEAEPDLSAQPQKVEVTSVNLQMKQSTKKYAIIAVIAVALVTLIVLIGSSIRQQQAEEAAANAAAAYASNLESATYLMLSGAVDAENAGNLIKSVWYNSIYEKRDSKTDKFTRPKGYFVSDFNDALRNLFSDSDFQDTIDDIERNQKLVADLMKDLKNPPEEYEDAYDAIKDLYDAYLELTNLATSPSGNLQSFSNNFNDADSKVLKYYNAMQLYISD